MRIKWRFTVFGLMILVAIAASCFAIARSLLDETPLSSPLTAGQEIRLRCDLHMSDPVGPTTYPKGMRFVVIRDHAVSPLPRWDKRRLIEVQIVEGDRKGSIGFLPRDLFWMR